MEKENVAHPRSRMYNGKYYVRYLNRPKRAKHHRDLLQVVKDISLTTGATSNVDIHRHAIDGRCCPIIDKINLSLEMKFKLLKTEKPKCGCTYRKHLCQQHKKTSNRMCFSSLPLQPISVCENDSSLPIDVKVLQAQQRNTELEKLRSKKHCSHIFKKRLFTEGVLENCTTSKYFHRLKRQQLHLRGSSRSNEAKNVLADKCQTNFLEPSKSNGYIALKDNSESSLCSSTQLCLVEAGVVCRCKYPPNPIRFPTSSLYKRESQKFCLRHMLSIIMTSLYTSHAKRKLLKGAQNLQSIPLSVKELVQLWCEDLLGSNEFVTCSHGTCKVNMFQKVCRYSYYRQRHEIYRIGVQKVRMPNKSVCFNHEKLTSKCTKCKQDHPTLSIKPDLLVSLLNSSNNDDPAVGKNQSVNSSQNSDCEKKSSPPTMGVNPSMVRASSRLKKKRDSGVQTPFGDDYIVEVPTYGKKLRKIKSSQPYGDPLFWNFYSDARSSESNKWKRLARDYFKMHVKDCKRNPSSPDIFSCSTAEGVAVIGLDGNTKENGSPCEFCGAAFGSPEEMHAHRRRHTATWAPFTFPLFSTKGPPPKPPPPPKQPTPPQQPPPQQQPPPPQTSPPFGKSPPEPRLDTGDSKPPCATLPRFRGSLMNRATARKSGW